MSARTRGGAPGKRLAAVRGGGIHANDRHVHPFQIALLELERTRRTSERQVALARIRSLEDRLVEIDALIRRHHDAAGAGPAGPAPAEPRTAPTQRRRTLRY